MDTNIRTALVTGATSGLGFEAAAQIAEQNRGQVIVTGRTKAKAREGRDALMSRTFKLMPGMSHDVADGARRSLDVAAMGESVSGQFLASPPKKLTGPLERVELPHIEDCAGQEAGWAATVEVSGMEIPASVGAPERLVSLADGATEVTDRMPIAA